MTRETIQTSIGWVVLVVLAVTAWRHYWRQPDPLDHMGAKVQSGVFYGERLPITPIPLYSDATAKPSTRR